MYTVLSNSPLDMSWLPNIEINENNPNQPNQSKSLWKSRIHCHIALCSTSGEGGGPSGFAGKLKQLFRVGSFHNVTEHYINSYNKHLIMTSNNPFQTDMVQSVHVSTISTSLTRFSHLLPSSLFFSCLRGFRPEIPWSTSHCSRSFRITSLQSFWDSVVGHATPAPCKMPRLSSVPGAQRHVTTYWGHVEVILDTPLTTKYRKWIHVGIMCVSRRTRLKLETSMELLLGIPSCKLT